MNCRGLGSNLKRKDVFNYLRQQNYSVICLQDTHFTDNTENIGLNGGQNVFLAMAQVIPGGMHPF